MEQNPVEDNFITRIILGFVVLYAMLIVGSSVGNMFSTDNGYVALIGFVIGALFVFVIFAALYSRYDQSYNS
ncbi:MULTISPECIES: hypothetical protein [unclassified Halorhabdus]|uniref:hypothetical protein n=1 Tax=unclassified Halorhabdus TaxID=2621901 RepID=UPI0023DB00B9|nr:MULTISPECIES: hypothetical protein [unclassified Halorhabdus]WEL17125.1 putative membrane protein [Halorhabdus sp. SVX81]WEL21011.1 putative membrane protein [Halorhabdus sp. BNX81]